jgi:hypothetical protein
MRRREDEFERIAMPHTRSLLRFARRLTHDASLAEDLVQETLLLAWRGFGQFAAGSNARAWLFRILINAYHGQNRKAWSSAPTLVLTPDMRAVSDSNLESLEVVQAFLGAGLGEPVVRFNFGDAPLSGFVSSVDRVLKRHPEFERFVTDAAPMPGLPGARRISNGPMSPAAGEAVPFPALQAIACGVPRSFPFHSFVVHFYAPEFGEFRAAPLIGAETLPGVMLADSWWINGRNRALAACTLVEADPAGKKLPPHTDSVAAVLAACGKVKKTFQAPLPGEAPPVPVPGVRLPGGRMVPSADPQAALAVYRIVAGYRARMSEIVERAALPHQLPAPGVEAYRDAGLGVVSGPRKPALERVFKPMG